MRILVTRPKNEAERTAARLRTFGHEVLVAPLIEIVATGAEPPARIFDGIVVTSAQAIEHLNAASSQMLRRLPIFVVGERTAAAAKIAGFTDIGAVAANAQQLGEKIVGGFADRKRWLYLAGRDRKQGLEITLVAAGCHLETIIVYEARAVAALPLEAHAALREGGIDAIFHYSRRSATILRDLVEAAGLSEAARRPAHLCLSEDAAAPLRGWAAQLISAEAPNEASMMAAAKTLAVASTG